MSKKKLYAAAFQFGYDAKKSNKPRVVCLNVDFMNHFVFGMERTFSMKAMRQYIRGWDTANLEK